MSFKAIFNWLQPHEQEVYELMNEAGKDLLAGMDEVLQATQVSELEGFKQLREGMILRMVRTTERSERIIKALAHHFMPAIEREAALGIIWAMDQLQGHLDRMAELLSIYGIPAEAEAINAMAASAVTGMQEIMAMLRTLHKNGPISEANERIERLHQIETESDETFKSALERIFDAPTDAIKVIEAKDLLQQLEDTIDQVQLLGNVIYAAVTS